MIGKQEKNTIFDTIADVVLCQKGQARLIYVKKTHQFYAFLLPIPLDGTCLTHSHVLWVRLKSVCLFNKFSFCLFINSFIIIIFFFFFNRCCWHIYRDQASHFYFEQLWAMCNLLWMYLYSSSDFLLELLCQCCNYMY